ncbi:type III secretion system export apparatus subunit SctT [Paludibacterium yongneupense]|uniref:type III secretion system export apparatus subunit SctT n=1 Tax=Paludibacterium yongneupense TaxID=400061 RepID=UPI00041BC26F|nr:type III secretion system export apparatus subunit SctT [Paludibacterium yongneupense]
MEGATGWLPLLALSLMRPLGALLLLPMFGSAALGGSLLRNGLALALAAPVLAAGAALPVPSGFALICALACEFAIGLVISFCAAIPFWAVDCAGYIIDTMRGASMASALNPALGSPSALVGILFSQALGVLFLIGGGFHQFLTALYRSYRFLPPGGSAFMRIDVPAFIIGQWQLLFELGLGFAMPAMIIMLLVDLALGFVNRSAPQLNVFFLSMPIKSVLGLLMLLLVLNYAFAPLLARMRDFASLFVPLWSGAG